MVDRTSSDDAVAGQLAKRNSPDAWQRRYRATLVAGDFLIVLASTFFALAVRFGGDVQTLHGLSYTALSLLLVPIWLGVLTCARAYEMRFLGVGEDEYRRVAWASWWLMAVIAVVCYSFKIQFARGYVAIALPVGTVLLLLGRFAQRKWLHARRKQGRFQHRLVAVGGREGIEQLAEELADEPYLGLQLVGVCLPDPAGVASTSTRVSHLPGAAPCDRRRAIQNQAERPISEKPIPTIIWKARWTMTGFG